MNTIDEILNTPIDEEYVEYYSEMAGRIPGFIKPKGKYHGDGLIIAVGDGELGGHPHFHVFRSDKDKKAWKRGACLMFKENRYFDHAGNKETLDKDELNAVINKLKEHSKTRNITWWKHIVLLWNENNEQYEIDPDTPMPNYDYDTITRWKE